MKIHLVMLGKTRRPETQAMVEDYLARIKRFAEVKLTELREDSAASLRKLDLDSAPMIVLLDSLLCRRAPSFSKPPSSKIIPS